MIAYRIEYRKAGWQDKSPGVNEFDSDAVIEICIQNITKQKVMEPVTTLVLVMGIIVTLVAAKGLYESRREMMEEYEMKRRQKLSYRTEEEFIGKPGE